MGPIFLLENEKDRKVDKGSLDQIAEENSEVTPQLGHCIEKPQSIETCL
jgi:hypothetical protein